MLANMFRAFLDFVPSNLHAVSMFQFFLLPFIATFNMPTLPSRLRSTQCFKMEFSKVFGTYFFLFLTNHFRGLVAEFSSDDCASLGFNKANLLCSVCDQLSDFKLDVLKESCYECCSKDNIPETTKKYAKARLEVCTCKFGAYPQIEAFIKSDRPAKFPNLSIRYVRGLDPIIKLMDKEGNVVETLAIDKWNTDSVEEFLKTYLEPVNNINLDYLQTNMV